MYKPHEKDIFGILAEGFKTLASLKKVGSKPKRRERVYKRAASQKVGSGRPPSQKVGSEPKAFMSALASE